MNFLSKLTGGEEVGPTPPQSPEAGKKSTAARSTVSRPNDESESTAPTTTVRLKGYSGLEMKTLWNHFNKDDLMTLNELSDLLDRILVKDATDIYASMKQTKGWREYCSHAMKILDTSRGNTIDLQEFSSEFNSWYLNRFYYVVKYLIPTMNKELKRIVRESGMDPSRIAELETILAGEVVATAPGSDSGSKEEIRRLKQTIEELKAQVNEFKAEMKKREIELAAADTEIVTLNGALSQSEQKRNDFEAKLNQVQEDNERLRQESDALKRTQASAEFTQRDLERSKHELESLREELTHYQTTVEENGSTMSKLRLELSSMRSQLVSKDEEMQRWKEASENSERETSELRKRQQRDVDEWKRKFDDVISENERCRTIMSDMRAEIVKVNASVLEVKLKGNRDEENHNAKLSSIHAASVTGIGLDPLRTELVNQFGSLDAVMGKRKRITLHELESIAAALKYSREYCRKLFYALDIKNRGFLSAEQFSRPLPMLQRELCLLTQAPVIDFNNLPAN